VILNSPNYTISNAAYFRLTELMKPSSNSLRRYDEKLNAKIVSLQEAGRNLGDWNILDLEEATRQNTMELQKKTLDSNKQMNLERGENPNK
jgi:hypothetical protein